MQDRTGEKIQFCSIPILSAMNSFAEFSCPSRSLCHVTRVAQSRSWLLAAPQASEAAASPELRSLSSERRNVFSPLPHLDSLPCEWDLKHQPVGSLIPNLGCWQLLCFSLLWLQQQVTREGSDSITLRPAGRIPPLKFLLSAKHLQGQGAKNSWKLRGESGSVLLRQ